MASLLDYQDRISYNSSYYSVSNFIYGFFGYETGALPWGAEASHGKPATRPTKSVASCAPATGTLGPVPSAPKYCTCLNDHQYHGPTFVIQLRYQIPFDYRPANGLGKFSGTFITWELRVLHK